MHPRSLGVFFLLPLFLSASPQAYQTTGTSGAGSKPRAAAAVTCADTITDQNAGGCLQASSKPTSGLLFPYPGANNTFTAPAVVAGGVDNHASGSRACIGGGAFNTASGDGSVIGGGYGNCASDDHTTVSGGSYNDASVFHASIGGGIFNSASSCFATISGGGDNLASGYYATVGGGYDNQATAARTTIAGGLSNTASATSSTIGGGMGNSASGVSSTIPGGRYNATLGTHSFAAGRRAKANHDGAFVWGDSFNGDKTSSAADEFNVYASGGTRIFSNSAASAGVLLAPGASAWSMVSDREAKENVEPVDGRAVLERVAGMPISTWNYREQDDSVRHMGPMAQDFYAIFGLGLGDKTIDSIDPAGVALAAIQGLNERLAEKDAQIAQLRERLDRLDSLREAEPARASPQRSIGANGRCSTARGPR